MRVGLGQESGGVFERRSGTDRIAAEVLDRPA